MIAAAIAIVALLILFVVMMYVDYRRNIRIWNNGMCPCEKGWWNAFDQDSSGATGYKCTECTNHIWIGWHRVTKGKRTQRVTLEPPRVVRKPDFIDLNDLEWMCNQDGRLVRAVCRYSTGIKRKVALGRCYHEEYHLIKDWFAMLPNEEAKAFAEWLLDLASASHQEQVEKEHGEPSTTNIY